jgi:gamma-glutamyltranspeptidase/glutathione hydrolase
MESDPQYAPFFNPETGEVIPQGSNFERPDYAATLIRIAEHGADAFYTGEIAEGIVKAVQAREGLMTLEDLMGK